MEKRYDLEGRAQKFAQRVRDFCNKIPRNIINNQYLPQLLRASSSPGANYIEANECLGEKDFQMKIKTCKREAKETMYWLNLILTDGSDIQENEKTQLRQESKELVLIFSAILRNHISKHSKNE